MIVKLACLLSMAPTGVSQAQGESEKVKVDGVLHVKNSEKPAQVVRVELEELWERGGDDDDIFFGRLSQLVHDAEGNLYVLDSQLSEIQVFTQSGDHLRTVGREGEGPGEFAAVSDMFLGPSGLLGLVRIFPGRVYQIGTDGSPADFFALPKPDGFQLVHVGRANGDRIVIAAAIQTRAEGKQIETTSLKAYDADGKELAKYCEEARETRFGGMQFDENVFSDFARRWALGDDGRVAVAMTRGDYRIDVYNPDGTLDRVIERPDHEPVKRTSAEKERFQKMFDGITRWNPNSTFKVSDHHTVVAQIWFRPNGNMWVLPAAGTYGRDEGLFASIDEYDRDGRYVRRLDFVVDGDPVEDGVFFLGDRMYRVTDLFSSFMAALGGDEGTEQEEVELEPLRLVAYRVNIAEVGMK
jgi:hypothetical protein